MPGILRSDCVSSLKALIICQSYHHKNTEKVASVIANTLGAEVKTPQEVDPAQVADYGLIGFGSGVYFGKHHGSILKLADKLPPGNNKTVFIFSTSGQEGNMERFHKKLHEKLEEKGYNILDEFNCPGYDTYLFIKLVGGLQKGRPNQDDLNAAQTFAEKLKRTYNVLLLCDKPQPPK
jgi:Flavodoxins